MSVLKYYNEETSQWEKVSEGKDTYSKTEVDNKLSGKSDTSHTHTASEVGAVSTSGGSTISNDYFGQQLTIHRSNTSTGDSVIKFTNDGGVTGYLGILGADGSPVYYDKDAGAINCLIHSGNYTNYTIPISGGSLTGTTWVYNTSAANLGVMNDNYQLYFYLQDSSRGIYDSKTNQSVIYFDGDTPVFHGHAASANTAGEANSATYLGGYDHSNFMKSLLGGNDLNTLINSGSYRLGGYLSNAAPNVSYGQALVVHGGGDTIAQLSFPWSSSDMYIRTGNPSELGGGGSYNDWRRVITDGNIGDYVTLTPNAAQVGADPKGTAEALMGSHLSAINPHNITPANIGAVPTSRTVNGKALSSNISLTASDVGARPSTWTPTASCDVIASGSMPAAIYGYGTTSGTYTFDNATGYALYIVEGTTISGSSIASVAIPGPLSTTAKSYQYADEGNYVSFKLYASGTKVVLSNIVGSNSGVITAVYGLR